MKNFSNFVHRIRRRKKYNLIFNLSKKTSEIFTRFRVITKKIVFGLSIRLCLLVTFLKKHTQSVFIHFLLTFWKFNFNTWDMFKNNFHPIIFNLTYQPIYIVPEKCE